MKLRWGLSLLLATASAQLAATCIRYGADGVMSGSSVLAPTAEVIYWTKFTYDQNNYPIYGGIEAVLTGTGIGTVRVALYRDVGAGDLVLSGVSSSRTVSAGSLAIFPDGADFVADGRLASGSWALALYVQANNLVPLTGAIAVPVGWTSPPWCGDQFPTFFSPVLTSVGTQIDLFMNGCRPGTFTPTRTPSFTRSPTPTKSPTQSFSPSPTSCGACTASATPTRTGVVSATRTPTPTVTPTASPTATYTRSATPTRTYVAVCVPPTASATPTATPTDCAACTATFSPTLTVTKTPTRTPTCVPHSSGGDIGVRVFDDANGNGVRDGGEALLSGVTVTGYHVEPCMGGLTVTGWETLPLSGTYIVVTYAGAPTSITVNLAGGGLPVLPLITTADPLVAFSNATNRYLNGDPIPYYDIGIRSGASPTPTPTDCAACSPTVSPTMSATPSATITLSSSPSETLTISPTMTRSPSGSPSATVSPTPTPTCACLYSPTPTPSTTFAIPTYAPPPPGSTGTYAYPVPAHGSVNFVVSSAQAAQAHVEVVTSAGSAVSTLDQALPAGGGTVVVDLRGFAPGIYFYMVRLTFADGTSQNLGPKAFAVTP